MRQFTPKEIEICKKIAERERKEIKGGDYVIFDKEQYMVVRGEFQISSFVGVAHEKIFVSLYWATVDSGKLTVHTNRCLPLWQEHDCLEWLDKAKDITLRICSHPDAHLAEVEYDDKIYYGSTPLEPLLRVILAILEEK